jgi:hypothetical protein
MYAGRKEGSKERRKEGKKNMGMTVNLNGYMAE